MQKFVIFVISVVMGLSLSFAIAQSSDSENVDAGNRKMPATERKVPNDRSTFRSKKATLVWKKATNKLQV